MNARWIWIISLYYYKMICMRLLLCNENNNYNYCWWICWKNEKKSLTDILTHINNATQFNTFFPPPVVGYYCENDVRVNILEYNISTRIFRHQKREIEKEKNNRREHAWRISVVLAGAFDEQTVKTWWPYELERACPRPTGCDGGVDCGSKRIKLPL